MALAAVIGGTYGLTRSVFLAVIAGLVAALVVLLAEKRGRGLKRRSSRHQREHEGDTTHGQ
jgi:hypothetical protein